MTLSYYAKFMKYSIFIYFYELNAPVRDTSYFNPLEFLATKLTEINNTKHRYTLDLDPEIYGEQEEDEEKEKEK